MIGVTEVVTAVFGKKVQADPKLKLAARERDQVERERKSKA